MTIEQNIKKLEKYFEAKDGFWWAVLYEVLSMFSNKTSFFSSKRFERFVMFNIAMWTIIGYVSRNWETMEIGTITAITGILLVGGAWNATQIRKDQTIKPNSKDNGDSNI